MYNLLYTRILILLDILRYFQKNILFKIRHTIAMNFRLSRKRISLGYYFSLKHLIAVNSTISLAGRKFCFRDRNYLDVKAIRRALMLD